MINVTARSRGDALIKAMDIYAPKPEGCRLRRDATVSMPGVSRAGDPAIEIVRGQVVDRDIFLSRLGFLGVREFDMEHVHATLQRL